MKWTFKFRSNAPLVSVQVLSAGSTWLRGRATLQNDEKKRKMGAVVKTRRMAEGGERREAGRRGNKLHICQQVASFVRAQRKALEREKEALKRLLQGRPTHRHNGGRERQRQSSWVIKATTSLSLLARAYVLLLHTISV